MESPSSSSLTLNKPVKLPNGRVLICESCLLEVFGSVIDAALYVEESTVKTDIHLEAVPNTEAKTSERPKTRFEVTFIQNNDAWPEWLARKEAMRVAKMLDFEGRLRVVDDRYTVQSWTWDIECVKVCLDGWVENGSIKSYTLKVIEQWSTLKTGKLTDYFG